MSWRKYQELDRSRGPDSVGKLNEYNLEARKNIF